MKTDAILLILIAIVCIPLFLFVNVVDTAGKALRENLRK
jgi:hypothetical protein